MNAIIETPKARGLATVMAERFQMEPGQFVEAIKKTVVKSEISNEQMAAFLMVAHEYNLNPLTKEIYAFPQNGGIQPIVSVDGWMKMINSHPQFNGMQFQDSLGDDGRLLSVTCKMYRKDREHPTEATEYMAECARGTEPWKKWPRRMLRHKAAIQAARYAFSFAGIMEPDEYERMVDITPAQAPMADRYNPNAAVDDVDPETEEPNDMMMPEGLVDHQSEDDAGETEPQQEPEQETAPEPNTSLNEEAKQLLTEYGEALVDAYSTAADDERTDKVKATHEYWIKTYMVDLDASVKDRSDRIRGAVKQALAGEIEISDAQKIITAIVEG